MEKLSFELGFDLDVHAIQGVRTGVFPLQFALVDDDVNSSPPDPVVISPFDPSVVQTTNLLSFRVYDFTDPDGPSAALSPSLCALQVLFSPATPAQTELFSPFEINGETQAQLATTILLSPDAPPSVAFGDARKGWEADWRIGTQVVRNFELVNPGRFNFRALLTVGVPGEMAKFYRSDPEMVIGDGGP